MQVIEDNAKLIGTWEKHTLEGQQLIGANAKIWTNRIKARSMLLQSKHNEAVALFGGTIEPAYPYKGFNYLEAPNFTKDYDNAIAIANRTDDIDIIANHLHNSLGLDLTYAKKIVRDVKQHYWIDEHLVEVTPQKYVIGRFFKDSGDISVWNSAINGDVGLDFQKLLNHEYIESKLMNVGLPFRGQQSITISAPNYGAHNLAPLTSNGSMTWTNLQRTNPNKVVDIRNLDDIVNFIKQIEGF